MKRFTIGLLVAALTFSLSALQAPANEIDSLHSAGEAILWYPTDRVNDAFDVPKANIGFGLGYDLSAQVTNYLGFGLGEVGDACNWGWNQDGVLPKVWHSSKSVSGAQLLTWDCGTGLDEDNMYDVGASVHVGLIGAGLAVDLEEVCDFAFGFLLVDFSADDDGPSFYEGSGDM